MEQSKAEKIVNNPDVHIKIQLERYKNGLIDKNEFVDYLKKNIIFKTKCPHCGKWIKTKED